MKRRGNEHEAAKKQAGGKYEAGVKRAGILQAHVFGF